MRCDHIFCVYWFNKSCSLDQDSLDIQGRCESCIYIDPAEDLLAQEREKILVYYEKDCKKWEET